MRLLSRLDFIFLLAIPAVSSALFGCKAEPKTIILKKADTKAVADVVVRKEVRSLAFGSCAQAEKPMPVLDVAIQQNPDLFIWLGDNVYGDSQDISILKKAYQTLGENPFFQRLDSATRLLATWDDHDYGWNDAGRHYPLKEASKEVFLDFWDDPRDAPSRQREGIYTSYLFDGGKQDVHCHLCSTLRTFRDDLVRSQSIILLEGSQGFTYMADYEPQRNPRLDVARFRTMALAQQSSWPWRPTIASSRRPHSSASNGTATSRGPIFPSAARKMLRNCWQKAERSKDKPQIPTVFITGDVHYCGDFQSFPSWKEDWTSTTSPPAASRRRMGLCHPQLETGVAGPVSWKTMWASCSLGRPGKAQGFSRNLGRVRAIAR